MSVSRIPLSAINVPTGRRRIDPTWVKTLADLMAGPDDCQPIELVARGDRFDVVFGGHRLAAAQTNRWEAIPAIVRQASDFASEAAITLREIIENLARRELSVLDRSVDIGRWREIYEAAHGAVRRGRPGKLGQVDPISDEALDRFAGSFSDAVRRALGINREALKRSLRIASISEDLRTLVALHPIADNQSELLQLAAEPADRQRQIVELLTRLALPAANVADAIAIMDSKPERRREAAWQKIASGFSRLKEAEQDRFFDLHEASIQRWLATRSAS